MKIKITKTTNKTMHSSNKLSSAINFIEELGWFFDSKRVNQLRNLPDLLRECINTEMNLVAGQFVSPDPNKHFLIGVLPRLFQDKNLFPTNEDIADFAVTVLKLKVNRSEKRSKYELIGLIVCETNNLDEMNLSKLVAALSLLTGNDNRMKKIIEARKSNSFSWNEIITELTTTDNND